MAHMYRKSRWASVPYRFWCLDSHPRSTESPRLLNHLSWLQNGDTRNRVPRRTFPRWVRKTNDIFWETCKTWISFWMSRSVIFVACLPVPESVHIDFEGAPNSYLRFPKHTLKGSIRDVLRRMDLHPKSWEDPSILPSSQEYSIEYRLGPDVPNPTTRETQKSHAPCLFRREKDDHVFQQAFVFWGLERGSYVLQIYQICQETQKCGSQTWGNHKYMQCSKFWCRTCSEKLDVRSWNSSPDKF